MKKILIFSLVVCSFFLFSCSGIGGTGGTPEETETSVADSSDAETNLDSAGGVGLTSPGSNSFNTENINVLVDDILGGGSAYQNQLVEVTGVYQMNYPSVNCDGFCKTDEQISALADSDFTFVNELKTYSTNLCDEYENHIEVNGVQIRVDNFPDEVTLDCAFLSSTSITLSGVLIYDQVYDFCEDKRYPNLKLVLDEVSKVLLKELVKCD